jgi:hypothetical protein
MWCDCPPHRRSANWTKIYLRFWIHARIWSNTWLFDGFAANTIQASPQCVQSYRLKIRWSSFPCNKCGWVQGVGWPYFFISEKDLTGNLSNVVYLSLVYFSAFALSQAPKVQHQHADVFLEQKSTFNKIVWVNDYRTYVFVLGGMCRKKANQFS